MGCRLMKKQHTESALQIPLAVSIILPSSKSTSQGQNESLKISNDHQDGMSNMINNYIYQGNSEVIQRQGIHICLENIKLLQMEDQNQQQKPIQNFQSPPITGLMSFIDCYQIIPDEKDQF